MRAANRVTHSISSQLISFTYGFDWIELHVIIVYVTVNTVVMQ